MTEERKIFQITWKERHSVAVEAKSYEDAERIWAEETVLTDGSYPTSTFHEVTDWDAEPAEDRSTPSYNAKQTHIAVTIRLSADKFSEGREEVVRAMQALLSGQLVNKELPLGITAEGLSRKVEVV
jgi:hypothetical protein